jgi:hypothetical protein
MKTKKAFIAKNRVYPSKDAAILCTGSKDVTVVNIREDYEFNVFYPELYYDEHEKILLIEPYCIPDIVTWHEAIEFQYVNGEFQQMFKEVELSITDLSQELQDEIAELVAESICSTCNGTGVVEVMRCKNGSNECCGGCYYEEQCEDCNK